MIATFADFVTRVTEEINDVFEAYGLFYLETYETQTERDGQTYKGVMIQSNLKDALCCSAFYLEDAYENYKSQKYDLTEFAVDTVKQFFDDFGDEIKEAIDNRE